MPGDAEMNNYQYRYSNYVGNRVVCESNWLLQASSCDGRIYDNLRKKFIEPHPHPELIHEAFNIKWEGIPLSVVLANLESSGKDIPEEFSKYGNPETNQ